MKLSTLPSQSSFKTFKCHCYGDQCDWEECTALTAVLIQSDISGKKMFVYFVRKH